MFSCVSRFTHGYYTFLRIYLTIVAAIMAYSKYVETESLNIWVILFGITAVIFNPIIPVYLHDQSIWAVIDIAVGLLFAISAFQLYSES